MKRNIKITVALATALLMTSSAIAGANRIPRGRHTARPTAEVAAHLAAERRADRLAADLVDFEALAAVFMSPEHLARNVKPRIATLTGILGVLKELLLAADRSQAPDIITKGLDAFWRCLVLSLVLSLALFLVVILVVSSSRYRP